MGLSRDVARAARVSVAEQVAREHRGPAEYAVMRRTFGQA